MLATGRHPPRRRRPHHQPSPGAREEASASASVVLTRSVPPAWRHSQQRLLLTPLPAHTRPPRLQHRQPWSWMSALVGVAVAALLTSVAEAGAAGDSRGGRSGSGGTVPWWYPSRDWGMLPSDYDGGGRGGWGGSGGGGGPGGWLGLRSVRFREEAKLAGEFVESWLADGLAEREEEEGGLAAAMMPVCDVHEAGNHTLRRLGASVDRCASPYYSLPEIHPSQLVYTEVDPAVEAAERKKKEQAAAARARRERSRDATGGVGGGASAAQGDLDDGFLAPDENLADAPAVQESDMEEEEEEENNFLGIFLFLKGDFFSVELENALTAVMPAYPRAWVVKADAPAFLSFCVQYDLHTFPQLLLFRNGHLMSRYRGRRTPEGLAAWFSLMMGNLPRAVPRRPLPPPPPPHPLSPPGLDEPLTWAALLYAATKIVTALRWLVKRQRRTRGGSGAAAGGRPLFRASAAVTRLRRWLVRVLFRSRGGGGGGGGGGAPHKVGEGGRVAPGGEGLGTGGYGEGEGGAATDRGGSTIAVVAGNS